MKTKRSATQPEVLVVMGSDSDWPIMQETARTLASFAIACEVRVLSAHRTPDLAAEVAGKAAARGFKVIIASAGMAAHLAGVLAAHTTLPVIGVPQRGGALDGLDALLSMAQMPSGIPVATVALGKAGAVNAAILATQILAVNNPVLSRRLAAHKAELRDKTLQADQRIQEDRRSS
jgi:5-(carboxyamino)imidazole ribonucleotide mutase